MPRHLIEFLWGHISENGTFESDTSRGEDTALLGNRTGGVDVVAWIMHVQ